MGNNNELNALFRKFIDNTCEEKELEKFYDFLLAREATSQIRQLLEDLWNYVELRGEEESGGFSDKGADHLLAKLQLFEILFSGTAEKLNEGNDKLKKT